MATPIEYSGSEVLADILNSSAARDYKFTLYGGGGLIPSLTVTLNGKWSGLDPATSYWDGTAPEIVNTGGSAIAVTAVHITSVLAGQDRTMFFIEHATQSLDPNDRIIYDPILVDLKT